VRDITAQDTPLVAQLLATISPQTYYARFFTTRSARAHETSPMAALICSRPPPHITLLATSSEHGRETAIALAECVLVDQAPPTGEIALLVHDDYQAHGIGTALFEALVQSAMGWPFSLLRGIVLGENRRLLHGLHRLSVSYTTSLQHGEVRIEIGLEQRTNGEASA
jgi:GNAT superfamily N-acetyltransferase